MSGSADGHGPLHEPLHVLGHEGVSLECPVSCLGVATVGDLVWVLREAGRVAGQDAVADAAGGGRAHVHERGRVAVTCPVGCLGLSVHVREVLRRDRMVVRTVGVRTVGELLALLESDALGAVRGMGPRRVGEVRTALIAAGFVVKGP